MFSPVPMIVSLPSLQPGHHITAQSLHGHIVLAIDVLAVVQSYDDTAGIQPD
jgi:hypothetical protein